MILAVLGFVVLLAALALLVAVLALVRSLPGMGFLNPLVEPVWDGLADMWAYKTRTVLQTLGVMLGSASASFSIVAYSGVTPHTVVSSCPSGVTSSPRKLRLA